MKKVLFVASEGVPFIKTGGLADVVGSLPKCYNKEEYDVRVILPKYMCMKEEWKNKMNYVTHFYMDLAWRSQYVGVLEMQYDGVQFYFIDNEYYFAGPKPYGNIYQDIEKFAFFSKAALSALPVIGFKPDIVHCHDWQTGLVPVLLKDKFHEGEFFRGHEVNHHNPQPEIPGCLGCKDGSVTSQGCRCIISHRISWRHTAMPIT